MPDCGNFVGEWSISDAKRNVNGNPFRKVSLTVRISTRASNPLIEGFRLLESGDADAGICTAQGGGLVSPFNHDIDCNAPDLELDTPMPSSASSATRPIG